MASGFPGRDLGLGWSGGGGGAGNSLKRTLANMERQQQQMQLQQALFLRSVKQRTQAVPSVFTLSPGAAGLACNPFAATTHQSPASTFSSPASSGFVFPRRAEFIPASAVATEAVAAPENRSSISIRDQLRELEQRLLLDDGDEDEAEAEASASSGSAVTHSEWGEVIQRLFSPTTASHLSPSPTNSSSSAVSFTSCSSPSSMPSPPTPPPSARQMLLDAAAAVGEGNLEAATANLAVLKRAADPRGDVEQRLTAVMVAAIMSHLNPAQMGSSNPIADLGSPEHFVATQMLYDLSPCFKLGFIAANSAILEATKDAPKIHILDFEVGHGGQYAPLLHALGERHRPPVVRVTAVADPSSPYTNLNIGGLKAVGDRMEKLAERVGVVLRFSVVYRRTVELDAVSLGCEPGDEEALVVNLAFVLSRVPDESVSPDNPRDELLRRLRALRPRLVALAEQEINTSTAAFPARLAEACGHYGALLESLEAATARGSPERGRAEAGLARRVVNAVAKEGAERVERCEVFGKWRARMGMAGFKRVPLGPAVVDPVKARVVALWPNPGLTVKEEAGGLSLGFGWMGRVVTVASAWY